MVFDDHVDLFATKLVDDEVGEATNSTDVCLGGFAGAYHGVSTTQGRNRYHQMCNSKFAKLVPISKARWFSACALATLMLVRVQVYASDEGHPPVSAGVPFFYYDNLEIAADWYENKLGLTRAVDKGWVVIFEITPTSYIGLVNATDGLLRPQEAKSAMLSIETEELEAWYKKLKSVHDSNIIQGIETGDLIEEFKLVDPGGYVVEFFRWRDGAGEVHH